MSDECSLCLQLLCRLLSSFRFLNFLKENNVEKIGTVCAGWIVHSETGLSVSLSLYPSRSFVLFASVSLCLAVYLSLCIMSLFLFFSFSLCFSVSLSLRLQKISREFYWSRSWSTYRVGYQHRGNYCWIHTASNNTTTMLTTTTFSSSSWLPKNC